MLCEISYSVMCRCIQDGGLHITGPFPGCSAVRDISPLVAHEVGPLWARARHCDNWALARLLRGLPLIQEVSGKTAQLRILALDS